MGSTLRGKWRLDALIGVGGMASVYAATHRNGHRVAIKMLHPALAIASSVQERFLREGYAANNVDHPGIARILDDNETEDGDAFLVMELLHGETLDTRWRRLGGRMPLGEALAVGLALVDVLGAAHRKGILHRDIKPENIFLTTTGQLKLLDFGIARVREQNPLSPSVTRTGAMLGTPAFMSPEQARGRTREVDGRSDLWSVGATLFTILSGRFVHPGETPNEVLINTATEDAPPLGSLRPDLPPEIAAIIDRSLAFQAEDRFADADAMGTALRAALMAHGFPLSPPFGDPSARPVSLPDPGGATVESAPPCAEPGAPIAPAPEATPGPAHFSLPSTATPPPRRRARFASAGAAVALAIAACFALLRQPPPAPLEPPPSLAAAPAPVPAPEASPEPPASAAAVASAAPTPASTPAEALPQAPSSSPRTTARNKPAKAKNKR